MRKLGLTILVILTSGWAAPAFAGEGTIVVYKDPSCGCCSAWAEALSGAGFAVELNDREDLATLKDEMGVPAEMQACHTATIDGYVLEGHVPIEAIQRLTRERPDITGLAVPGMPLGSLGMGEDPQAEYDVYAISKAPSEAARVFQHVGPQ
jgi:hypothetical protein